MRLNFKRSGAAPDKALTIETQPVKKESGEILLFESEGRREWVKLFQDLIKILRPSSFTVLSWHIITQHLKHLCERGGKFLDAFTKYGYSTQELLGCHPTHPEQRHDYKGVILCLGQNRFIDKVTNDEVTFIMSNKAVQALKRSSLTFPKDAITLLDLQRPQEEQKETAVKQAFSFPDLNHYVTGSSELWGAMNKVVLNYMAQDGYSQGSKEIRDFILQMYEHYKKQGLSF